MGREEEKKNLCALATINLRLAGFQIFLPPFTEEEKKHFGIISEIEPRPLELHVTPLAPNLAPRAVDAVIDIVY